MPLFELSDIRALPTPQVASWARRVPREVCRSAAGLRQPQSWFSAYGEVLERGDVPPMAEAVEMAVAQLLGLHAAEYASCENTADVPGMGMPPRWALDLLVSHHVAVGGELVPSSSMSWASIGQYAGFDFPSDRETVRSDWRQLRRQLWTAVAQLVGDEALLEQVSSQPPLWNAQHGGRDPLAGDDAVPCRWNQECAYVAPSSRPNATVHPSIEFHEQMLWWKVADQVDGRVRRVSQTWLLISGLTESQAGSIIDLHPTGAALRPTEVEAVCAAARAYGAAAAFLAGGDHRSFTARRSAWRRSQRPWYERHAVTWDTAVVRLELNGDGDDEFWVVQGISRERLVDVGRSVRVQRSMAARSETAAEAVAHARAFREAAEAAGATFTAVPEAEFLEIQRRIRGLNAEAEASPPGGSPRNRGEGLTSRADGPNIGAVEQATTTRPPARPASPHTMPTENTPFLPVLPRKFGVELEAKALSYAAAHEALEGAGLRSVNRGSNWRSSGEGTHWEVIYDGSLQSGFEAVSPPLQETVEVWKACRALRAAGARVDAECGTHVHVDGAGLGLEEVRRLALAWLHFELAIDTVLPRSRRGNGNSYCRSNRARVQPERLLDCSTMEQLVDAFCGTSHGARYHKLNLVSWWRHGTVEFRCHSGSLNGAKLSRWITLVVGMVEAARLNRPLPEATTLAALLEWVAPALPSVFAEETDVEDLEPTVQVEEREVEEWVRDAWAPNRGHSVTWAAVWDAYWNSACDGSSEISDEERMAFARLALAVHQEATAASIRVAFQRWRRSRIGYATTRTERVEVTVPAPLAQVVFTGDLYAGWFRGYFEQRVTVLQGAAA